MIEAAKMVQPKIAEHRSPIRPEFKWTNKYLQKALHSHDVYRREPSAVAAVSSRPGSFLAAMSPSPGLVGGGPTFRRALAGQQRYHHRDFSAKAGRCRSEHLLTVVGVGSVFPEKMLVEQGLGNRLGRGIDEQRFPSQFRHDLQGKGIFDSLGAGGSPGERSVPGY
jgi:hypothetical protein